MPQTTLFWPIPRDILQITNRDSGQLPRLRSLVTYQYLFGGKLVIRDSDYLNCLPMRRAVVAGLNGRASEHEQFLKSAVDERMIEIAQRRESSLGDTAVRLGKGGGAEEIPRELYTLQAPDLLYLQRFVPRNEAFEFSVVTAGQYFTDQVLKILGRPLEAETVPDHLRVTLLDRVREQVAENGPINWHFLAQDGGVWRGISALEHQSHSDYIYRVVGQAAHTGFLPDTLQLSPIYMNDVARSVDLWRGRHLFSRTTVDQATFDFGKGFSFSDYVESLCRIPIDEVLALAESDERTAFDQSLSAFAGRSSDLKTAQQAYAAYRRRIDERILAAGFSPKPSGAKARIKAVLLDHAEDAASDCVSWVIEQLGAGIPFFGLAYKIVKRLAFGESDEARLKRRLSTAHAASFSADLHTLQGRGNQITGRAFGGPGGTIDRHIDIALPEGVGDTCVSS